MLWAIHFEAARGTSVGAEQNDDTLRWHEQNKFCQYRDVACVAKGPFRRKVGIPVKPNRHRPESAVRPRNLARS
jgi:hypothetical protein